MIQGRPSDNPLIVHVAAAEDLSTIVEEVDDTATRLISEFWPGPLTIVFKSKGTVSSLVTCGKNTVAVRQPSHPLAIALISAAGVPLAAPSANKSGRPSPTLAKVRARIRSVLGSGAGGSPAQHEPRGQGAMLARVQLSTSCIQP